MTLRPRIAAYQWHVIPAADLDGMLVLIEAGVRDWWRTVAALAKEVRWS